MLENEVRTETLLRVRSSESFAMHASCLENFLRQKLRPSQTCQENEKMKAENPPHDKEGFPRTQRGGYSPIGLRAPTRSSTLSESHIHSCQLHNHLDDGPSGQAKCGQPFRCGQSLCSFQRTLGIRPRFARRCMTTIRYRGIFVLASLLLLSHFVAGQAVYGNIIG